MKKLVPRKLVWFAFFAGLVVLYTLTRGNVRWRVLQRYPTAEVYYSPVNSPDLSFGTLWRAFGVRYFSRSESVGIRIRNHPTPIDFRDFNGMTLNYLTLHNCVLGDIKPLLTMYGPDISFHSCDLSRVPDDQKRFISYQAEFDRFYIYCPPEAAPRYPGGVGLHSERFYP